MTVEADPDVLDAKAATVERAFEVLDEIQEEGVEAVRGDLRTSFATRRALQEAAEAALDVAGHLVARNGYRNAEDYADLFTVLGEEDVISDGLAARLEEMARFRNVLVHGYAEIDPEKLWAYVTDDREDIVAFVEAVYEAVETSA